MNIVCLNEVKALMEKKEGAHVSIFMPTHRAGGASKEDVIRFKNLTKKAEEWLVAKGERTPEARNILLPAEKLLQDNLFWRQQSDGLALFLSPGFFLYYNVPLVLEEMVAVADRFHIKPLIPLLGGCGSFYVLALSQGEVKFLQATRYGSTEIALPEGTPVSLGEAKQYTEVPGKQVRYHSAGAPGAGQGVIFHGAGLAPNYDKDVLLHFFDQVNKGLHQYLKQEKSPLVLMGVEYLLPLYRKANTYQNLLPQGIPEEPIGLSGDEMREKAWTVVQPYFKKAEDEALGQYRASAGTGQTSNEIKDVVAAAKSGRIRFLFVTAGLQQWGSYSAETGEVVLHKKPKPGDDDLLDFAAVQTLANDGAIFVLDAKDMPDSSPMAAVFRY